MSYRVDVWYAEHESVGDKFYKVFRFISTDQFGNSSSFALFNYGPRSVSIKFDSASTGQGEVTSVIAGAAAGVDKVADKRKGGYKKNEQSDSHNFESLAALEAWVKERIGSNWRKKIVENFRSDQFKVAPSSEKPVTPDVTKAKECHLHESKDYGTW